MIGLALLIGGQGKRLGGVDKASIVLSSGVTTADTLLATFRPLVDHAFAVGRADQLKHPLSRSIEIIQDDRPGEGPLRGIATALGAARTPWVFILACDIVGLSVGDLTALAAERARARMAIAWRSPRGPEPLCALYHRELRHTARAMLARGERRATCLLEHAYLLPRSAELANLNTPEELSASR